MRLVKVKGRDMNVSVSVVDEFYRYIQVTPESGLPFYMRYDKITRKWKPVAEIFKTDPEIVKGVGEWLSENYET